MQQTPFLTSTMWAQVTDAVECVMGLVGMSFLEGGSSRAVAMGGSAASGHAERLLRVTPRLVSNFYPTGPAGGAGRGGRGAGGGGSRAPPMLVLTADLGAQTGAGGAPAASGIHITLEVGWGASMF